MENQVFGSYVLKYKNQKNQTSGTVDTKEHWENIKQYVLNKANIDAIERFTLSYNINNKIKKEIVI